MAGRRRRPGPDQMAFDLGPAFNPAEDVPDDTPASAMSRARQGDLTELLPYRPTPSINPPRPRTQAMGYDRDTQTMTVQFREGAVYEYHNVSAREWNNMRRVKSPGKAINRTFNDKPYNRRYDLET